MKKLFAILLTVAMLVSMATIASAASTTTLTTTVPAASYTLNIPVDQKVNFGATQTNIGELSVTNSSGFATGKNLQVTITYTDFACADVSTKIPFELYVSHPNHVYSSSIPAECLVESGNAVTFPGQEDGTVAEHSSHGGAYTNATNVYIEAKSEDWGKALAGEYTATITFTAEVVVE